jgi:hypothetical protein
MTGTPQKCELPLLPSQRAIANDVALDRPDLMRDQRRGPVVFYTG